MAKGKGTELQFCPKCSERTPHMKVREVHTGGMVKVERYDDYKIIHSNRRRIGGWCTLCKRREREEEAAALKIKQERDLAEAKSFLASRDQHQLHVCFPQPWTEPKILIYPVEVLDVEISRFGDRKCVVHVEFEGKNPFFKNWPTWEKFREHLCDEQGNLLFPK